MPFKIGVSQGLTGWFWAKTWRKWGRETLYLGKEQTSGSEEIVKISWKEDMSGMFEE